MNVDIPRMFRGVPDAESLFPIGQWRNAIRVIVVRALRTRKVLLDRLIARAWRDLGESRALVFDEHRLPGTDARWACWVR